MREIKFRGKRADNGEWVYGDLSFKPNDGTPKITWFTDSIRAPGYFDIHCFEVLPESVSQFTGMCDGQGGSIYEGDVLLDSMSELQGDVNYSESDGMFAFYSIEDEFYDFADIDSKDFEIIGNIHDNPELMRVSTR